MTLHFNHLRRQRHTRTADRAAGRRALQYVGDDRGGAVYYAAAGDCGGGVPAERVGVGAGRGDRGGGWADLGGAGGGVSAGRRVVCVFARDLWAEGRGELAELSLRLAVELFGSAGDCFRVHWALEFSGVVLAGAGERAGGRVAGAALCELCRGGGFACW